MNKKAFLPLLLIMLPLHAYGQVPEEYYKESQLYPNQKSNDELGLSIDNTVYAKGNTVNVFGVVQNYSAGITVHIQVYDPTKKIILDLSTLVGNAGNFKTPFQIPHDAIPGKYTVSAKYGDVGKIVSVFFIIKGGIENMVAIPRGSGTADNKFNFTPKNITINYGAQITWVNNDDGVHTVVSGKLGLDDRIYADGLYDSGPFGPQQNFTQSFFMEGTHLYFCKLHPWLTGQITVKPYTGPPDQKPKPPEPELPSAQNMSNTYLFIATKRQPVGDSQKTLFGDNMASVFKTWVQSNSSTITKSDVTDAKAGKNSMKIQVKAQNGDAAVFVDYAKKLQDWSHYNYLNYWFKGQNTNKTIATLVLNETWKAPDQYGVVDDSSDWKKVQIPLYTTYKNIDMSKIRGLNFHFAQTNGEFFIDDVVLSAKTSQPSLKIDSSSYIFGDTIQVSGSVTSREYNTPVTIKVIDPTQNIVTVKQIVTNLDNTFNFTLPVLGHLFDKEGTYKISAQYGAAQYQNSTAFKLTVPQLVETYKGFDVYQVGDTFYSVLKREGGFDINRIRADQYSVILSGNSLDDIKKTIDESIAPSGKPPSSKPSSFPVSDGVLLAIWKERKDLQSAYPEVAQGNLENLKLWAIKTGWKEDSRLSALIPRGEIPDYLKSNKTSEAAKPSIPNEDWMLTLLGVAIIAITLISAIIGYRFLRGKKQPV